MSYQRRYGRRVPRAALGDSVIDVAAAVASDPYLPEVICRIEQLKQIENGQAVATCPETLPSASGGVGIRNVMPVLRGYVYAQQNPWIYPVAALAVVGLPLWIGYLLGKASR